VNIKHNFDDGLAQVDNYFTSTIKNYQQGSNVLEASILGHLLVGKEEKGEEMYTCTMIRDGNKIMLNLHQKLDKIICWKKDKLWN
jgi:hypothetical protein